MNFTDTSDKNEKIRRAGGEEDGMQDYGGRSLNGTYGDFFGGNRKHSAGGDFAGGDPGKGDLDKGGMASGGTTLVFGEDPGERKGETSKKALSSGRTDRHKKEAGSGRGKEALAEKGRDVVSALSRRADSLLRRQKDVSVDLREQTDALKRANDALKEVQSLLDNPLYDGMPSLTGNRTPSLAGNGMPSLAGNGTPSLTGNRTDKETDKAEKSEDPGDSAPQQGPSASDGGIASDGALASKEAAVLAEEKPKEPEKDPMEELDGLIGLSKIKHDVKELTDFVRIQKLRKEGGLKSVPVSLHLVFTGNPGTGKTTVARILARLYQKIGVLSKGQLIEVDRSGLVAGYVGQTALKTAKKIEEARGGILFIDEAYTLARRDDTFGQEAIDTILKAMEDNREDFVVIVAGYTGPMENFINSNPGLKSRFNKYIEFPDYTIDELMGIFDMNCKKYDYEAQDDVRDQIRAMIVQRRLAAQENFANAREVRNLFEEIITNQARRVAAMESPTQEDMKAILADDLFETAEEDAAKTLKKAQETEASREETAETEEIAGKSAGEDKKEAEKSAGAD